MKRDLKKTGCEAERRVEPSQGPFQWRAVLLTVLKLWILPPE
jgi:hypothetical protein